MRGMNISPSKELLLKRQMLEAEVEELQALGYVLEMSNDKLRNELNEQIAMTRALVEILFDIYPMDWAALPLSSSFLFATQNNFNLDGD
jgi:hypothetical protein